MVEKTLKPGSPFALNRLERKTALKENVEKLMPGSPQLMWDDDIKDFYMEKQPDFRGKGSRTFRSAFPLLVVLLITVVSQLWISIYEVGL